MMEWQQAVVDFLKREADFARHAQGNATTDTDKLYRMGQKDGLLLAAEAIERGAVSLPDPPPATLSPAGDAPAI